MKSLKRLVAKSIYADEAHFSDELLLPVLAQGHHITLVTAFVPSYLVRLASDLASSPEIEPGKLSVLFCIPFSAGDKVPEARLLSKYLSQLSSNSDEVRSFLDDSTKLVREGGLRFGALLSKDTQMLTPGCIGIIESGSQSEPDVVSFVDAMAGDLNSPITIQNSWDSVSTQLDTALRVVTSALNRAFPNLLRRSHDEVMALMKEVRQKGYPRLDFPGNDGKAHTSNKARAQGSVRTRSTHEEIEPDNDSDDLEFFPDEESEYIEKILKEVFARESGLMGEDLSAFLGEPSDLGIFEFDEMARQHTPPLSQDLLAVVGHGYTTCWCGESFDREQGCPANLY